MLARLSKVQASIEVGIADSLVDQHFHCHPKCSIDQVSDPKAAIYDRQLVAGCGYSFRVLQYNFHAVWRMDEEIEELGDARCNLPGYVSAVILNPDG